MTPFVVYLLEYSRSVVGLLQPTLLTPCLVILVCVGFIVRHDGLGLERVRFRVLPPLSFPGYSGVTLLTPDKGKRRE